MHPGLLISSGRRDRPENRKREGEQSVVNLASSHSRSRSQWFGIRWIISISGSTWQSRVDVQLPPASTPTILGSWIPYSLRRQSEASTNRLCPWRGHAEPDLALGKNDNGFACFEPACQEQPNGLKYIKVSRHSIIFSLSSLFSR